jgi:hypothetical protein
MKAPPDSMECSVVSMRVYEVRVAGLVPTRELMREFGEEAVVEHEVRTVVTGRFTDQAALHGFLHRLRAFGLEVVEVRRVQGAEEEHDTEQETEQEAP